MKRSLSVTPLALVAAIVTGITGCDDISRYVNSALSQPGPGYDDADRDLSDALPVFPGAEGFGTDTPGGRGGDIVIVDTLAADGPGSLREALSQGNRIVLFAVGGTILVNTDIQVSQPFVTVFGESAPSPGVTLVGAGLYIETHDVMISHLSIRPGDDPDGPDPDIRDAVTIARDPGLADDVDVGNIVVDHCSLSWAIDETASTTYDLVHDVTFSNTIVAEALNHSLHSEDAHSKGIIIGKGSRRVAVLNNLFAHNNDRNPLMNYDSTSVVAGNVVYNPGEFGVVHYGLPGCCPAKATIIGNRVIPGEDTPDDRGHPVHIADNSVAETEVYLEDNCGGENRIDTVTPVEEPPVRLTPLTVGACDALPESLLPQVGARWWDRSAQDQRVIDDVQNGTGRIIDAPPDMDALRAQAPTTHELVLPDAPHADEDGDGYTEIEAWAFARRRGE